MGNDQVCCNSEPMFEIDNSQEVSIREGLIFAMNNIKPLEDIINVSNTIFENELSQLEPLEKLSLSEIPGAAHCMMLEKPYYKQFRAEVLAFLNEE